MSYVGYGGSVSVSTPSVGALVADAIRSVVGDPTVKLSPQTDIILSTSKMAIEGALGKSIQTVVSTSVSSSVTDMASDVVGEIANAVPMVGAILGWFVGVVKSIVDTYSTPSKSQEAAQTAARCNNITHWYKPLPTGLGGVYPCDIFAKYIPLIPDYDSPGTAPAKAALALGYCMAHSYCQRPFIGSALIAATETNSKVPAARKAQFKKLREAMAAQFMRPSGDGGESLWPIYMDLMLTEADAGHMSPGQILASCTAAMKNATTTDTYSIHGCCAAAQSLVIATMDQWSRQTRPIYTQDVAKYNELKAQAAKIKADAQALINKKLGKKPTIGQALSTSLIATIAGMTKPKTTTAAATKKPLSPVVAVGIGMAIAAGGAAVLISRAKHPRRHA
jgi:hypothetical protein